MIVACLDGSQPCDVSASIEPCVTLTDGGNYLPGSSLTVLHFAWLRQQRMTHMHPERSRSHLTLYSI